MCFIVTGSSQGYYNNSAQQTISVQQPVYPHQLGVPSYPMMSNLPYQSQPTLHIQPSQFQQTQRHFAPVGLSRDVSWPNVGGTFSHPVSTANIVPGINLMTDVTTAFPGNQSLFPIQSASVSVSSLMTSNCSSGQQSPVHVSSVSDPSILQV